MFLTHKGLVVFALLLFGVGVGFAWPQDRAVKLFEEKQYDAAKKLFESIQKSDPTYAESNYYLGLIAIQQKEMEKAEQFMKKAVSVNGQVAKYHLGLVNLYGQLVMAAKPAKQATYAAKIKSHMESAVRLDPKDINTRFLLIGFYAMAPKILGGDKEKARKTADEIMNINRAEGFRALGTVAQAEEQFADAEIHLKRALSLAPDSLKHYQGLAAFYQSRAKNQDALIIYERAIARFPDNHNLLLQAGRTAAQSGPLFAEKGKDYLNAYLVKDFNPTARNKANAHYYLGMIEMEKKNPGVARKHYEKALQAHPEHRQARQALESLGKPATSNQ